MLRIEPLQHCVFNLTDSLEVSEIFFVVIAIGCKVGGSIVVSYLVDWRERVSLERQPLQGLGLERRFKAE